MGRRRTDGWRDEGLTDRLLFPLLSTPRKEKGGNGESRGENEEKERKGKKSGGGKKGDITDGWREERKFFFSHASGFFCISAIKSQLGGWVSVNKLLLRGIGVLFIGRRAAPSSLDSLQYDLFNLSSWPSLR